MLTISKTISRIKSRLAFVPFITAGYPNINNSKKIIELLDKKGADLIEVGIPYSDALADGIIIQESSRIALNQKVYIDQVLKLLKQIRINVTAPLIVFTYFNPVLSRGVHRFIKEIAESGAKGLVIPDLPLEESDHVIALCNYYSIELILFVSPASSKKRINEIISKAPGALYLVSSYGVTGFRNVMSHNLKSLVISIKENTNKYIMLGFGISDAEQVSKIVKSNINVDAIVMGTALIQKIKKLRSSQSYDELGTFCESIRSVMHDN